MAHLEGRGYFGASGCLSRELLMEGAPYDEGNNELGKYELAHTQDTTLHIFILVTIGVTLSLYKFTASVTHQVINAQLDSTSSQRDHHTDILPQGSARPLYAQTGAVWNTFLTVSQRKTKQILWPEGLSRRLLARK